MSTPTATAAPPSDNNNSNLQSPVQTATATAAPANASPLLRAWRNPPVAPAVAVVEPDDENHHQNTTNSHAPNGTAGNNGAAAAATAAGLSGSGLYSYPVATFVRDFLGNATAIASGSILHHPTAPPATTAPASADPYRLSTRSEPSGNLSDHRDHQATLVDRARETEPLSVRTVDDRCFDDDTEFILVDGDLIAIPPPPPNHLEQEGLENNARYQNDVMRNARRTAAGRGCGGVGAAVQAQPSRFRRGVRKLNKFFAKRRERKQQQNQVASASLSNSLSPSQTADQSGALSVASASQNNHHNVYRHQQPVEQQQMLRDVLPGIGPTTTVSTVPAYFSVVATSQTAATVSSIDTASATSASIPPYAAGLPISSSHSRAAAAAAAVAASRNNNNKKENDSSPKRKQKPRKRHWRRSSEDQKDHDNQKAVAEAAAALEEQQQLHYASIYNHHALHPPHASTTLASTGLEPFLMESSGVAAISAPALGQSVTASFICTADQLLEAGVLPAGMAAAEAYVEFEEDDDYYSKKCAANSAYAGPNGEGLFLPPSRVARDADMKVDKADAPDVEAMLRRAVLETQDDNVVDDPYYSGLGAPEDATAASCSGHGSFGSLHFPRADPIRHRHKSDGQSVPLSVSCAADEENVHNDILKVLLVGCLQEKSWLARTIRKGGGTSAASAHRARRKSTRTLAVDVHTWPSSSTSSSSTGSSLKTGGEADVPPVRCALWDVQGAATFIDGSPNFGGHPSTQSLFFSHQSLYVLVWDLAGSNIKTYWKKVAVDEVDLMTAFRGSNGAGGNGGGAAGYVNDDDDENDDDEDDEYENEFEKEERIRQADRALNADIQSRVLSWVDCIAARHHSTRSAILPVAIIPLDMSEQEVARRCEIMQARLEEHVGRFHGDETAPKLLTGAENIICVKYAGGEGVDQLRATILAIATDSRVFDHVLTPVPQGTALVYDIIRQFKEDHKLILVDHLLGAVGSSLPVEVIINALHFLSSTGEILYFGTSNDEVLSQYIILSRKWLVSALSCILRNDLENELATERPFMRMQCFYSDDEFPENEMAKALLSGLASSCPLLSDSDARMLWNSKSFMKEAANSYSQLTENSTSAPSIFYFLERLLVHTGIFVPLGESENSLNRSEVFFVPSLLAQVDPAEIWSYRSSESWKTTLCHSWLFRSGAPSDLMECITASLLKDLYQFSKSFPDSLEAQAPQRAYTAPVRGTSFRGFYEEHDEQQVGRVKIHQMQCWQSSVLVKIGTTFADKELNELREGFAEILITVVDQSSNLCVASDAMRSGMYRVIVSGKGQVGHHGRKLWKGGYKVVIDSVRSVVESYANVDSQVVCPDCIAQSHPQSASTWVWDDVLAVAESSSSVVRCMRRGHRVDSNLLCGTCKEQNPSVQVETAPSLRSLKPVSELLPSVVVVGLWDPHAKIICKIGSGFVVDRKFGLILTAGHTLINMEEGRQFGTHYFGVKDAKVAIGVIPDGTDKAVFRYLGEICADDIHNVDACVIQIRSRLKNDVDDSGSGIADEEEVALEFPLGDEKLKSLKLTTRFELDESVRILGFNQGGEGVLEQGKHVNRSADFAKGYICKKFTLVADDDSSSHSSDSSSHFNFSPREEIVAICPTIPGHSGGPCVNEEGRVVGILSRADPVDRQRCYLVPAREMKILLNKVRKKFVLSTHCTL